MNARHYAAPYGGHLQLLGPRSHAAHPLVLAHQTGDDVVGQRYGRSAGSVLFLRMVRLLDRYVVLRKTVHHTGQHPVYPEHQIHSYAVIRRIEESAAVFLAKFPDQRHFIRPCGGAAHDRHAALDALCHIFAGRSGRGELHGHVDACEFFGTQVGGIVRIDNQRHVMSSLRKDAVNLAAHFSVSYNGDIHIRPSFSNA